MVGDVGKLGRDALAGDAAVGTDGAARGQVRGDRHAARQVTSTRGRGGSMDLAECRALSVGPYGWPSVVGI